VIQAYAHDIAAELGFHLLASRIEGFIDHYLPEAYQKFTDDCPKSLQPYLNSKAIEEDLKNGIRSEILNHIRKALSELAKVEKKKGKKRQARARELRVKPPRVLKRA